MVDSPNTVETWLWKIAAKKIAYALAKGILSVVASSQISPVLQKYGVQVDPAVLSVALPTSIYGVLEAVHDWFKVKTGSKLL